MLGTPDYLDHLGFFNVWPILSKSVVMNSIFIEMRPPRSGLNPRPGTHARNAIAAELPRRVVCHSTNHMFIATPCLQDVQMNVLFLYRPLGAYTGCACDTEYLMRLRIPF